MTNYFTAPTNRRWSVVSDGGVTILDKLSEDEAAKTAAHLNGDPDCEHSYEAVRVGKQTTNWFQCLRCDHLLHGQDCLALTA